MMRIFLKASKVANYRSNSILIIEDWFAEQANIKRKTASIEVQTEKAIVLLLDGESKARWIPKSLLKLIPLSEKPFFPQD